MLPKLRRLSYRRPPCPEPFRFLIRPRTVFGLLWVARRWTAAKIMVESMVTRRDAHVRMIQLRVTGEAIFFDHLVVRFEDGTSQELMISERILPGVRDFELLGVRSLKSVELWYYKQPEGHNPKVTLYGVRSPEDEGQTLAQSR